MDEGGSDVGTSLTRAEESQVPLPDTLPTSANAALCGSGEARAEGGSSDWPAMREWVGISNWGRVASAETQTQTRTRKDKARGKVGHQWRRGEGELWFVRSGEEMRHAGQQNVRTLPPGGLGADPSRFELREIKDVARIAYREGITGHF